MNVESLMTHDIESCSPDSTLTDAAMIMWRRDCGIVPVVNRDTHEIAGVITDRDICMAAATRHARTDDLYVRDVMTSDDVTTVTPDESVRTAVDRMAEAQVRRIPVADRSGVLIGMISLNDIVLAAEKTNKRAEGMPTYIDTVDTLKAVCAHRTTEPRREMAAG
ncbi:MAG TPA: CBS domain-containing protein [Candidatus Eisenbacteria bacterium]|jgi:CBS domain-containing protein|nr:CBS domain-containing protein [Candidatus Eisenbacteria bacterium]